MIREAAYRVCGRDERISCKHTEENQYEVLLVHTDGGHMLVRDRLYPMRAGTLYLINAAEPHCSIPDRPADYCRSKLILARDGLHRFLEAAGCEFLIERLFGGEHASVIPAEAEASLIERRLETIARLFERAREEERPVLHAAILSLLDLCARGEREPAVPEGGVVSRALAYISQHLGEHFDLDQMAAALYVSKCYLCRAFHRSVGMTVMEYVNHRRLARAKQLLLTTEKTISQIADEAGFSGFSYFCSCFRRVEGVTPSAYRKSNR